MSVTTAHLIAVFGRIGVLSFGGPAAQIGLMHRELVDKRPWLTEQQFLSALSFCMFLPGPEAMQLATYAGWRLRGVLGGLIAGALFVLPGAAVMLALTVLYVRFSTQAIVEAAFLGIKAAVIAIVLQAMINVSRRALTETADRVVAALAFLAIFALGLPFPVIVMLAGLWGAVTALPAKNEPTIRLLRRPARTLLVLGVGLALWGAPIALAAALDASLLLEIGLFFSRLAVVTFGGAYAVLAYMAQEVVQNHGWLSTPQMMDGLGLAETTPGPLILVTQFVGTLAGHGAGGWPLAIAGAAMTLWVTFVPCFIWIFTGAPYVEWITAQPRLKGALHGIMASVVGVIANLSIVFAIHVLFKDVRELPFGPISLALPAPLSLDPVALALAVFAALALFGMRWGLATTLGSAALLGALISLL